MNLHSLHSSCIAAALVAASSALTPARADDYPSKPIKFIVPAAPAGIGDILPRMFAQKLGEAGNPATIVVENRPGGNGVLAYDAVAKAPPDGYHDADGQSRRPGDESASRQEPALRSVQELCADHSSGDGAQHPGGAPFRAGELAQGADRLRQGQSRQAELCLAGHRRLRPHRGGIAQAARRHRHRACAVPGRRAAPRRTSPPATSA